MTISESPDPGPHRHLRTAALIALVIGAAGSVALMLRVGQRNPSSILMVLFAGWVSAPFIGLGLTEHRLRDRSAQSRTLLYGLMLVVAALSLVTYARVAFGPPRQQPAALFLMVPVACWVLIAAAALVVRRR